MDKNIRVLIAGATGTLGMPLMRALTARGYEVTGLTRSADKRGMIEQAGASAAVADALDARALEKALRDSSPDWVVDLLTAIPKNGPTRYSHMTATNTLRTQGTENLLQASASAGATRIVGESMTFAYGFGDHGLDAKVESDPLQQKEPNLGDQAIVDSLRSLENQYLAANQKGWIEAIPLRYGLFYGADSPSTLYMLALARKRLFPMISGSNGINSWIHTADAVSATIAALENGQAGEIYNIVDDCPVGMNDWVRCAAQLLGAKPPFTVPLWLLRLAMPYMAAFFSARLPVSSAKAKRDLQWQPHFPSYKEGLQEIVSKYRG